jgi:hypothetical protein
MGTGLMAHTYIIGQSGSGKTTLLFQLILRDIAANRGVFYITPHVEDADKLLTFIPKERAKDVIIIDPTDDRTVTFSPLNNSTNISRTAGSIVETLKDVWNYRDATPTMALMTYALVVAILEAGEPFIGCLYMLLSPDYRTHVLSRVKDRVVKDYWILRFNESTVKEQREESNSTFNKLFALFSSPVMRHFFSSSSINLPDILKDNKIVICRLDIGQLGKDNVKLIGSLLLTQLHLETLKGKCTFSIFLDEFHHFAGQNLDEMFSGIRKYGIELTVAHQYLAQLEPPTRASALGNCANKYIFRVTTDDAKYLNDQLKENQMLFSLETLPKYYARVVQDGKGEDRRMPSELPEPDETTAEKIRQTSRRYYGKKRDKLEKTVAHFFSRV